MERITMPAGGADAEGGEQMKRCTKIMLLICALLGVLIVTAGCGNGGTVDKIEMNRIREAMLSAGKGLPEMSVVDDSSESAKTQFAYLSTMDYHKVDQFFLAYASDGNQHADEIAVIAVKQAGDVKAAEKSLNRHMQKRRALYEQYNPSQLTRIDNAQIFTKGRCAVLILCGKQAGVKAAFEKALGK